MNDQKIIELLSVYDASSRSKLFSLLSAEEKMDFGRKIAKEILNGRARCGNPVIANIIKDTTNDVKNSFEVNIDAMAQTTKLLRSKVFKLHQVVQSSECKYAFDMLSNSNSDEISTKKAEELIITIINAIDAQSFDIGDKLFDEILQLPADYKSPTFARIFASLAQKYMSKLQFKQHKSRRLLPILLEFSKCPETVLITLNLWNLISDMKLSSEWSQVFEILMRNLSKCLQSKMMSIGCEEEDNTKFQSEIMKTLEKISRHVDAEKAFDFFSSVLYEPEVQVVDIEIAFLFLEEISPHVNDFNNVNKVLQAILELSGDSIFVLPGIKFLKGISRCLKNHPERIQPVLHFLMKALSWKESIADAAACAFKEICRGCKKFLIDQVETFYQIFLNFNIFNMSKDGQEDFIKALCSIVSYLPEDKLVIAMTEICRVQIEKIFESSNPKHHIDHLAEIFAQIDPHGSKKSTAKVFMDLWPTLSNMMDRAANSPDVLRKIMESIKCAVNTNGSELMPIFEDIIGKTLQYVNDVTCEKALGIFNKICTSLGDNFVNQAMTIFETAAIATFNILRSIQSDSSLIVEKFYKFACDILAKFPIQLMQSPMIIPTIELAIGACCMDIKDSKPLKFLEHILTVENTSIESYQREVMSLYAERIIFVLLRSSMFIFTDINSALTSVSKIFAAFKKASNEASKLIISNSFHALPNRKANGSLAVNLNQSKVFLQTISRPNITAELIKNSLIDLRNTFNSP